MPACGDRHQSRAKKNHVKTPEQPAPTQHSSGVTIAVLMPHAPVLVPALGDQRLSEVASTIDAMREVARRLIAANPDSLVAVSPHSPRLSDAFGIWTGPRLHGSLTQFGAPNASVSLPIDATLATALAAQAQRHGITTWEIKDQPLDHGAVVPLWFLAEAGWRGPTVVLSLNYPGEGGLQELGKAIAATATHTNSRIAFLASGDMSHRLTPGAPEGFQPRAQQFDQEFIATIKRGAYRDLRRFDPELQDLAAEDALDSTLIAVAAANWNALGHEVLSYEGPFGVGYGVAVLFAATPSQSRSSPSPSS